MVSWSVFFFFFFADSGLQIVDLEWEKPTASGLNRASGFCQPELEAMLEEACRDAGIDILRGLGLSFSSGNLAIFNSASC